MKTETLITEETVNFNVYGWPVDSERHKAVVFIGFGIFPVQANATCTPDEARQLAAMLVAAANEAEWESPTVCMWCNSPRNSRPDTKCHECGQ